MQTLPFSLKKTSFNLFWLAEHLFNYKKSNELFQKKRKSILKSLLDENELCFNLSPVKEINN
ncbi:MAG: hypothetical protein KDD45_10385, partial [Bdellovibrionales bacterium]|nr:hypothetical protein [Bdellovibrionales bacterium]